MLPWWMVANHPRVDHLSIGKIGERRNGLFSNVVINIISPIDPSIILEKPRCKNFRNWMEQNFYIDIKIQSFLSSRVEDLNFSF